MTQTQSAGRPSTQSILSLGIRGKIVLPYLLLTLAVAIIGTYVVTSLVASSLDERLTNQLLEAGRVVSDSLARYELSHIETAQVIAFTRGLDEALRDHERAEVLALAQPAASGLGLDNLIVVDAAGDEMLHLLKAGSGSLENVTGQFDISSMWIVHALLEGGDPHSLPKRGLGVNPVDQRYYYFTAIPVGLGEQVVGVVVVGTPLDSLLAHFKATSLADVIVYVEAGRPIATTFALQERPAEVAKLLDELPPAVYEATLRETQTTSGENIQVYDRPYRLARGPLRVGNDTLGVFAIVLPTNFIIEAGATSRNTYALIFTLAMACVVLVGYLVARRITLPLGLLLGTARAVADGHLGKRTGIQGTDEIGMLATTFDGMTEKLEERTAALERALQAEKETASRLQAILASIGDGVLLGDANGHFIPMNAAAHAILEEMAATFHLSQLQELSSSEPATDAPSAERRRFQLGKKIIRTHSAPVRTDDGKRLGTVIVLQDVTAEVKAEQLKDAFVAHVSHELRTPLTAIKGYSQLLLGDSGDMLDEQQRGFLSTITRHTDSLVEMINGLLDFSEMEAKGSLGLQRQPLSLSRLVEDIAREWRPRMAEKELAFELEAADGLPRVDADARRLRWALINLIRNAWQYTPPGGKVSLRLFAQDGQVIFDVADTGPGIAQDDLPHLFTRFYRSATQLEEEGRGFGLGLYVSKAIVEAHGGEIRVASQVGAGSTFSIVLPALAAS